MIRLSGFADYLRRGRISRPFPPWVLLLGSLATLFIFFFSVRLLGAATDALSGGVTPYLRTVIDGELSALGVGWLGALVLMNGSVVAALSVSLLHSGLVNDAEFFMMISGTRLGGSGIVFLIGVLDHLQRRHAGLEDSTSMGVLTFLITHSIYIPATALGFLLLPFLTTYMLDPRVMDRLTIQTFELFTPVTDLIIELLGGWLSIILSILILFLSLKLFAEVVCCLDGNVLRRHLLVFLERKWIAFFAGMLITMATASVAFSLGIFVPLYNRKVIKKKVMIPYIMGANIGTFSDTLLAGIILETVDGVLVVFILTGLASVVTMMALAVSDTFIEAMEFLQNRIVDSWHLFLAFMAALLLAPLLLVMV